MLNRMIGMFGYTASTNPHANTPEIYYKPPTDNSSPLAEIPEDMHIEILSLLSLAGLNAMMRTDKQFNKLGTTDSVFKIKIEQHFPSLNLDKPEKNYFTKFKSTYNNAYQYLNPKQRHFISCIKEGDLDEVKRALTFTHDILHLLKKNTADILVCLRKHQTIADYLFAAICEHYVKLGHTYQHEDAETNLSSLHWLALLNPTEELALTILPEFKASASEHSNYLHSPLYLALSNHHLTAARLLLERNARINFGDQNLLYIAAQEGWADEVRLLVAYHYKDLNWKYQNEFTPLYIASQGGHIGCVDALLSLGADHDIRCASGSTPFYIATQEGHVEVLKLLYKYKPNIEVEFRGGFTPLYIAARNGHTECVKFLISCKAKLDANEGDGSTPLYVAAQNGHANNVEALAEAGANLETSFLGGYTPLYIAAQNGFDKVLDILLKPKFHAKINHVSPNGSTALYVAAQNGHASCVEKFLAAKANLSLTYGDGYSPAYVACQKGHLSVVKVLLPHFKSNLNHTTDRGATCLYVAAQRNHVEIVKLLLAEGADPGIKFQNGFTTLHIAAAENRLEIVELLSKAFPALLEEKDNDNRTALDLAILERNTRVADYLRKAAASRNENLNSLRPG